jgi:flagellar biosynthesis protein FlhG
MNLNDDHLSLYDVLELTPDATPQEIRSAYLRLKSSYSRENIAHYTLFSREETEKMLQHIENAYIVLSNPETRRNYDLSQGQESVAPTAPEPKASHPYAPITGEFLSNDPESLIKQEHEWGGAAIKRIREARRITLDDLCDYTRISRTYLQALEEEDYNKLPASVYVRGFLQQVGKRLKIPVDTLVNRYIERLKAARPDKA